MERAGIGGRWKRERRGTVGATEKLRRAGLVFHLRGAGIIFVCRRCPIAVLEHQVDVAKESSE
jgi:hypothetical protein